MKSFTLSFVHLCMNIISLVTEENTWIEKTHSLLPVDKWKEGQVRKKNFNSRYIIFFHFKLFLKVESVPSFCKLI